MMMNLRKGYNVWIQDKDSAWLPAEILDASLNNNQIQVLITSNGKKVVVSREKLYIRDADADHAGVDDMTKLPYLNEPEVLYNLARRYALNDIYTYTGSILIAVNPFTRLPHLYNSHMMEQYKGATLGELSPHVFAVADASYRAMVNEGRSQSILVSGESGAGKTETTKLIMQYLTYVGGRAASDDRTVEQQVLESNPLLEAFGNARTVRNDNSSRFGKFVEIQFDVTGRISGAAIRTYLLERSRVVQITDPERNYHCFYQLCASGKDAEKYKLGHPSQFHYLNQSKTYELEGVNSEQEYMNTRRAMDVVGISLDEQQSIFRTLAAILHLGNIDFSPGKEHDSSTIKDKKSSFHLQMVANLFMCDVNLLLATLSTRSIQTREGLIVKALDCNGAIASRDALAKTVYARLFDWLVEKINSSVGQDKESKAQIGVLDIYGFECFKNNSFEQFCINFANEKLQQHFNEHVFKMEQEEYTKEEINWSYIDFVDNQDVLDLIEKKPIGIIALLDEACMFPRSTNATFCTKLFQCLEMHKRLQKAKFSETSFGISHYAGQVAYQTDSFLDKNRDYVVVEHSNLLSSSKCSFVAGLFPSLQEEASRSSYKFSSVASRFKQQLQSLMESLSSTEPHYVRCVKPNSMNRAQKFENASVLHQLRCGGVLEAVRISLAGYPTRRTYSEFVDRFGILVLEFMDGSYDEKALTEKILTKLHIENFQLGKSKIFLRAGQIAILDSRRAEVLDNSARRIQNRIRTFIAWRNFTSTRKAAVVLQAYCRGCVARNLFALKRAEAAALFIQKYVRRWLLRRTYIQLYSAVVLLQSNIRGISARQKFMHKKEHKAAMLIQARWRMFKVRSGFKHYQSSIIAVQCLWRKKLARRTFLRLKKEANETGALRLAKNKLAKQLEDLTWRLNLEKRLRVSNEEARLAEISKLQNTLKSLSKELDVAKSATTDECNKNSLLQSQLELSLKEKSALENRLIGMADLSKENALLKSSLESFESQRSSLASELVSARKESNDAMEKLREVEQKCTQLKQNVQRMAHGLKSPLKFIGFGENASHVEARYPAILFKQQLTACVEKIFGFIRDNLKKELSPLLGLCIQAPKTVRVSTGKPSRSPGGVLQPSLSSHWDSIIKFLDSLLNRLRGNFVPSFFIRKLITQVFSFINISLFNSLLLRRECCTFSNGEYVKSGLAELEKWIVNTTEEFAGTSWHELNYIRQAVGFLVIHQKRKKSLEEIKQDLCPALTVRQIYRICTMYWDDKYGTQSVSNEAVAEMRDILNKDAQTTNSNSFLLDDDLSIPFSTEDISKAIPAIEPSDVELPPFLRELPPAQFLVMGT
ncbi:hypothetical protein ACHQM5_029334 [Ranunculus cassubicifolius]